MNYGKTWGWITPPCLFQCPKIILSFFLLLSFSQVVGSLYQKCDVSSFLWVWKHPRSKVNKCYFVLSSSPFMLISFCINFPSCSFRFAFVSFHLPFMFLSCSFHLALMSFHVPSLFIKHAGLRKVICSNRSGGYPPKRSRFHHISLSFLLSCCYRFGGLCRLPLSGFMNMYMYKFVIVLFYSYHFLGR